MGHFPFSNLKNLIFKKFLLQISKNVDLLSKSLKFLLRWLVYYIFHHTQHMPILTTELAVTTDEYLNLQSTVVEESKF